MSSKKPMAVVEGIAGLTELELLQLKNNMLEMELTNKDIHAVLTETGLLTKKKELEKSQTEILNNIASKFGRTYDDIDFSKPISFEEKSFYFKEGKSK